MQDNLPTTSISVIETESTLSLTRRESLRLLELMENQQPGNEKFLLAQARYQSGGELGVSQGVRGSLGKGNREADLAELAKSQEDWGVNFPHAASLKSEKNAIK